MLPDFYQVTSLPGRGLGEMGAKLAESTLVLHTGPGVFLFNLV